MCYRGQMIKMLRPFVIFVSVPMYVVRGIKTEGLDWQMRRWMPVGRSQRAEQRKVFGGTS